MAARLAITFVILAIASFAADLRIGVLSLFRPERVTVRSSEVLWVQAGPRTLFLSPGQVAGLRGAGAEVDLFAQSELTASPRVSIAGRGGAPVSFQLTIDGKIDRKFSGRLEVTAVGSRLEPVVLVDLESAVAAVVAAEMPRKTPAETLKAMAVLARSYYTAAGRRHGPYDFCDTTHCQWRRESIAPAHPAAIAAQATKAVIVTYQDRPFAPMYHASCGGRTKSAAEVDLNPDPYPYFPVDCAACTRESEAWVRRLPLEIARPIVETLSESLRLTITRTLGWDALPSNSYQANIRENEVVVTGHGQGHGVGICQRGATSLGLAGKDFRAILAHYLPNTRTLP